MVPADDRPTRHPVHYSMGDELEIIGGATPWQLGEPVGKR
jgi:hypothetical protein